jgi:hypothetical protein
LEKPYSIWQPTLQTLLSEHKLCQAVMVRDLLQPPWAMLASLLAASRALALVGRFASTAAALMTTNGVVVVQGGQDGTSSNPCLYVAESHTVLE